MVGDLVLAKSGGFVSGLLHTALVFAYNRSAKFFGKVERLRSCEDVWSVGIAKVEMKTDDEVRIGGGAADLVRVNVELGRGAGLDHVVLCTEHAPQA